MVDHLNEKAVGNHVEIFSDVTAMAIILLGAGDGGDVTCDSRGDPIYFIIIIIRNPSRAWVGEQHSILQGIIQCLQGAWCIWYTTMNYMKIEKIDRRRGQVAHGMTRHAPTQRWAVARYM